MSEDFSLVRTAHPTAGGAMLLVGVVFAWNHWPDVVEYAIAGEASDDPRWSTVVDWLLGLH